MDTDVDYIRKHNRLICPIHTFGTLHPQTAEYAFFSNVHRTLTKINYILGHNNKSQYIYMYYRLCSLTIMELNEKSVTDVWKAPRYLDTK